MPVIDECHSVASSAGVTPVSEPVRVLAISHSSRDLRKLREIIGHSNWVLRTTSTYGEAVELLHEDVSPVVITERDLPPYSWKDVLRELASMTNPPRLIVASENADAQLWGEVLNLGAYDVLPKPLASAELFATVSSAWRAWKYSEVKRLYCETRNRESTGAPPGSLSPVAPARKPAGRAGIQMPAEQTTVAR